MLVYNNSWEMLEQTDKVSSFSLARDDQLLTLKILLDSAIINYENSLNSTPFGNTNTSEVIQNIVRFNVSH